MLEGSNSSTALSWVREDLDGTLEQVRRNLEEYAGDTSSREVLQTLQEQLEQLNLTFVTMQQQGAIMLTDEMIAVGGNLIHNGDVNVNDSISALSDAVIVLPAYLDRLQAGHDDLPILLLPTLNELRASYDETLLSEGTLFAPDLEVDILEIQGSPDEPVSFSDWPKFAKRIRTDFQAGLLAWLKEQSNPDLIKPLQAVCEVLVARLERKSLRRLWWIASNVMTGVQAGAVNNDLPLRRVFARLDLCLKAMAEDSENGPTADSITALSRALLFQVAQSKTGCEAVDLLRDRFRLEDIIPDRDALLRAKGAVTGRDAKLFYSIGQAIQEEMSAIKDSLDMELRTGKIDSEARTSISSSLVQLSDTLRMLDLPVAASALEQLLPSLELTREVENFELDSPLLALAQQLLEVESVLAQHISLLGEPYEDTSESSYISLPVHEQRQIMSRMLDEAVQSLHAAQDAIRERLEGDPDADYISPLQEISGALLVAGQGEVAKLADKLERAFNAKLLGDEPTPDTGGDDVRRLTDAVAALELYLTGCRDQQANSLRYLDIMQARLEGFKEVNARGEAVSSTVVHLPDRAPKTAPEPDAVTVPSKPEEAAVARDEDRPPPPIDSTMQDIFLEEYTEVCKSLADDLAAWVENPGQRKSLEGIRRGFHTLKGSGRMVGAKEVGDFSWRLEQMLNRVLEGKVEQGENVVKTIQLSVAALPLLRDRLMREATELTSGAIEALGEFARQLSKGESPDLEKLTQLLPQSVLDAVWPEVVDKASPEVAEPETVIEDTAVEAAEPEAEVEETAEEAAEPDAEAKEAAEEAPEEVAEREPEAAEAAEDFAEPDADPTLVQLVIGEVREYLGSIEAVVAAVERSEAAKVSVDEVRAAHSMVGSLSLLPLGDEPQLARAMEQYLQSQVWANQKPRAEAAPVLRSCLQRVEARLAALEDPEAAKNYRLEDQPLIDKLIALTRSTKANDREGVEETTPAVMDETAEAPETPPVEVEETVEARDVEREDESPEPSPEEAQPSQEHAEPPQDQAEPKLPDELADLDPGILQIFMEEAQEVLERCDTHLNAWRDKLSDIKLVQNLQRDIHTFKGGARMAGLEALGELSHAMETLLENIAANRLPATVAAVQALEEGCDQLTVNVEQLRSGHMPETADALERFTRKSSALTDEIADIEADATAPEPVEEEPAVDTAAEEFAETSEPLEAEPPVEALQAEPEAPPATVRPEPDEVEAEIARLKPAATTTTEIDALEEVKLEFRDIEETTPSEEEAPAGTQIRVAANLMDSLVNYSGEVSIYRARLEEQLGTVRFNLKEVDQTVARLNDQLRKMAMETEAQMLSRYGSASNKGGSDFDPLELDRFSNIQQLSRALSETVNDLASLHEMLDDSVRQAESLLAQQSRVSTDLQEGLMQTRMTPFAGQAPRFRRVVRTAASESGKSARLRLLAGGTTDRLDRNVLERITAPLEHMLRNAVVHGIETPAERRKAKKPEEGTITVAVSSEATEFVIRVEDDGRGLDLDAIRKRAKERGLISKGQELTPRQLGRLILESGFTTSKEVTGLAGRGVGMDVVNSEIKQMGGSLEIATEAGKGTRFTVRIPFSLAVMQVIGLNVGSQSYMVPLNSVAGVGRMSPTDYARVMKQKAPTYEFAGEKYPLMELGPLVGLKPDRLGSGALTLLIVDTGEQRAALRISGLRGHQEAVIKPIGPQISSIPGILGGTISGDGKVVIILDIGPLIRHGAVRAAELLESATEPSEDLRPPLVMVTDDSITMRKVTSRVLESHALKVITAKDGVDAVEKLHECVPDLILLDIEMPRMDGYELAEYVRGDSRLKHVPIIMVTSRAGQKHRKRARQIGANGYLTKPYQESELIEQVGELLKMDLTRVNK